MNSSTMLRATVAIAALGAAFAVQAEGLMGTTVNIRYDYSGYPSLFSTVTVGPSVEMDCYSGVGIEACAYLTVGHQSVDIDADSFTYRMADGFGSFVALPQNGFTFWGLNPGYAIGGVALDTNIPSMNAGRISFSADSLSVYAAGVYVVDGSYFKLTLQPVPEPSTASLWAVGLLAGLYMARRVRRG